MGRKLIISLILSAVFCSVSIVYAMSSAPSIKNIEITAEPFAPGTYKTYKNDDLGYSFKYPRDWYLNGYEKFGFYYYILSNRENRTSKVLSENETFEVEIYETSLLDHGRQSKENIIRKISEQKDSIKYFKEINVLGGTVYLVRGSAPMVMGDVDFGYLYLIDRKDENGKKLNYLIEFLSIELSKEHEREYMRVLRSIEIFN